MNVNQIESFLEIARLGSFSKAAEYLNLTQSTISSRIQQLEDQMGAALFYRSRHGIRLTHKGRELLPHAQRLIDAFREIRRGFIAPEEFAGSLRIGVAELVAVTWLPDLTQLMHERYPKVALQYEVGLNPQLIDKIRNGLLDMAFCCPADIGDDYQMLSLGSVAFGWMASRHTKLPAGPLSPTDIAHMGAILQGESFTTAAIQHWLGKETTIPRATCNSLAAIRSLVGAGAGVGLLPIKLFEQEIQQGELQLIHTDPAPPNIEFCIMHTAARATDPLVAAIRDLAIETSTYMKPK